MCYSTKSKQKKLQNRLAFYMQIHVMSVSPLQIFRFLSPLRRSCMLLIYEFIPIPLINNQTG